jgi:hypothetical protein
MPAADVWVTETRRLTDAWAEPNDYDINCSLLPAGAVRPRPERRPQPKYSPDLSAVRGQTAAPA